jgi:type I restriction enzyme, S subunit
MTARALNWKRVPIKHVYHGLYDGPHATPKPAEDGPVFLGIKNVTDDGRLDLSDIRHISESEFPNWTKRVLPQEGDIVFTYEATLNRYAIIPKGFRGCLGRRMALIRTNPEKVDTRFLFQYFFSEDWRRTISQNTLRGSTVDRIPLTKFPGFGINLPPIETQRKIASILSAYDDLIENNTRRIKILEEMAQAIYREWLVNFHFPGHEKVKMVDSPLRRVPEGWAVVPVTMAVEVNPRTKVPKEGEKPFVPMGSLSNDSMLITDIETRDGNSGSKFKNADTLFARITPCLENGKTGYVQFLSDAEATAFGSTEFIVLRSRTLCPEYVYLMARSSEFRDNAIKSMSGATGRQRVSERCFEQFFIAQPDAETLTRFSGFSAQMFKQIFLLADKIQNLREARDLLLPKLISGAVDVSELEIDIKGAA